MLKAVREGEKWLIPEEGYIYAFNTLLEMHIAKHVDACIDACTNFQYSIRDAGVFLAGVYITGYTYAFNTLLEMPLEYSVHTTESTGNFQYSIRDAR